MRGPFGVVFVLAALASAPGCGLSGREIAFVRRDDVALSVPAGRASADGFPGEAHELVANTAAAIDGWVGDLVDVAASVVAELGDHRETRRDGAFRLYGPFDDTQGRDVSWLVKVDDDHDDATFELWVGPRGAGEADVALAMHGHITTADDHRSGEITLEYDAIDGHRDLRPDGQRLAGAVTVVFERERDHARVELRFADFLREDTAGNAWSSSDTFVHERESEGGGSVHAVFRIVEAVPITGILGELDVAHVELDARWDASAAGRTRARAPRSANPDSALPHGDLLLHECFDPQGGLTYRELSEPYAADRPAYGFGNAANCVFDDADLDAT
jgi:hypothetical protein